MFSKLALAAVVTGGYCWQGEVTLPADLIHPSYLIQSLSSKGVLLDRASE